ncbi:hypothetical protein DIURU_002637 [Diutina rugosa]|uniref:CS domain-containing protein n=1 Tax=Diutina rugosa TaxID=5481 RepID=A0A642UNZ7_DIURU|nr:uncharacterized protein DIURU_002637 [Diutina rugosa]KAA8902741.1 hypothetical protein DIURU_002637 [Diutina rugosa]
MLTPKFSLRQDDEFVYVDIELKHIRLSSTNVEMVVEGPLFVFSMPPYYLRLRFPHEVVDDDERSEAKIGSEGNVVHVKLPKAVKGQFFPDLDLQAKLLARTVTTTENDQSNPKKPLIEELDVDNTDVKQIEADGNAHDWEVDQKVAEDTPLPLAPDCKYGFNNLYHEMVGVSVVNGNDINELGDPEGTPAPDRILERLIKENVKFDLEIYAGDYIAQKHYSPADDDKVYADILKWEAPSTKELREWRSQFGPGPVAVEFTEKEQELMMKLPRKTYLVDNVTPIWGFVCSFLFGYFYELRGQQGDLSVESAWTVGKLTPQIADLDSQLVVDNNADFFEAVVITGIRRALSYPYHRNYDMAMRAWQDVNATLSGGKRLLIRVLLAAKELFRFHDVYYIYDKIWMDDVCTWLISDQVKDVTLDALAVEIKARYEKVTRDKVVFEKADEDGEFVAWSVREVDEMAEELYQQHQQQ